jgi:hypothetical protein
MLTPEELTRIDFGCHLCGMEHHPDENGIRSCEPSGSEFTEVFWERQQANDACQLALWLAVEENSEDGLALLRAAYARKVKSDPKTTNLNSRWFTAIKKLRYRTLSTKSDSLPCACCGGYDPAVTEAWREQNPGGMRTLCRQTPKCMY